MKVLDRGVPIPNPKPYESPNLIEYGTIEDIQSGKPSPKKASN